MKKREKIHQDEFLRPNYKSAAECAIDAQVAEHDGPDYDESGFDSDDRDLPETCTGGYHVDNYSWWENDAQGIPLARVCDACVDRVMAKYRPEILTGYSQSDVDEPIEPD